MRRHIVALTMLAVLGSMTACGGSDSGSGTESGGLPLTPAESDAPALCGTTVAAQDEDAAAAGRLVLMDLEADKTRTVPLDVPRSAAADPSEEWAIESSCARTRKGPLLVVSYGRTEPVGTDEPDDAVAGLFGVTLRGQIAWYTDVPRTEGAAVNADGVLLEEEPQDLGGDPTVTVVDADNGRVVVDADELKGAQAVAADRIGYGGERPVLADGSLAPVWTGEESDLSDLAQWYAGDGVAVLMDSSGGFSGLDNPRIRGVDARTGDVLWTVPIGTAPGVREDALDPDAGVLITDSRVNDERSTAEAMEDDASVLSGIDVDSGKVLWSRRIETENVSASLAGGGVFGTAVFDGPTGALYDSRTGEPVDLPDDASVVDAGSEGVLVDVADEFRLLEP